MIAPEWLEPDVVLFLHDQALREFGGMQGLRDENLMHSALARPLNAAAYGAAATLDLFDLAASYAFGLAGNHAFNDGNKRTGWSCCVLFLKINGVALAAPPADAVERMIDLATRRLGEADFAVWLRSLQPSSPPPLASRSGVRISGSA